VAYFLWRLILDWRRRCGRCREDGREALRPDRARNLAGRAVRRALVTIERGPAARAVPARTHFIVRASVGEKPRRGASVTFPPAIATDVKRTMLAGVSVRHAGRERAQITTATPATIVLLE